MTAPVAVCGNPTSPGTIRLTIPIRTISEANAHTHWRVRAKRAKEQRGIAAMMLRAVMACRIAPPFVVTITRISPRTLDSDNLAGSQKHIRDGLADQLQINDADPRVEWRYAQEKGTGYAVRIEIHVQQFAPTEGEAP